MRLENLTHSMSKMTRGRVSLVVKSIKNQSKEKGKSKSKRDRKDEDLLFCS